MTAPVKPPTNPAPQTSIKISAAYGRLYISGPGFRSAVKVPGAAINDRRKWVEISLTLESLRALRKALKVSPQQFAKFLTPDVLAWAKAAGASERQVNDMHTRLDTGWRMEFPWFDSKTKLGLPYRPPFDHQVVMTTVACSLDGSAFLCEMGTGKSKAAVEAMRYKLETGQIQVAVVFCPRGVIGTWKREIPMWSEGLTVVPLIDMPVKVREKVLDDFKPDKSKRVVFVVNYDVAYLLESAVKRLSSRMVVGLVLDEMHRVRNPQAKVTKSMLAISQRCRWRLGMTGTPILQGAQDIWAQWYMVDLGITFGSNHVQFKREFFDENRYDFSLMPHAGALDEIGARMRRRGLRFTKADCLDLPPKTFEPMEVIMSPEQKRAYKEMEAELIARLTGGGTKDYSTFFEFEASEADEDDDERVATASNQLAMILRLTQITSGFVPDSEGIIHDFSPNPKLDAVEEIVEENIEQQQIIIWARYRHDHANIAKRLARFNPKIIRGGVSTADRDDIETGFQDGRYRLLIGQPAAGGVGLNLFAASLAVYYSQSYSLEHRLQSEDRCHRSGSEMHNKVTYIDINAKDTIDAVISEALAGKKSVADVVVDLKKILGINV